MVHKSSRDFAKDGFGFTDSDINRGWYNSCPVCGAKKKSDTTAALIELGFAPAATDANPQKKGVQSCSSFTYAREEHLIVKYLKRVWKRKVIADEYGRKFTGEEFDEMLRNNCPIRFTKMINTEFS